MMPAERAERLRRWHIESDQELREGLPRRMLYLDLELLIPEQVFTPSTAGSFHALLRDEVQPGDRVLDMGTGSGISAILASRHSTNVLAVDINPKAVAAARANAIRNGVGERIKFKESDIFDAVPGRFDLITFNPPYRWFKAHDLLEMSTADEDYRALTKFMQEVGSHLRPRGRILLNFATSGDIDYLYRLIDEAHFKKQVLAIDEVVTEDLTVTYYVFRLTRSV
jgi:release factor glutamine methyltransferase